MSAPVAHDSASRAMFRDLGPVQRLIRRAALLSGEDAKTLLKASKDRNSAAAQRLARIRFGVMLVALRDASPNQIARVLKRDHTSVHYGIRKARELVLTDQVFAAFVRSLETSA